MNVVLLNTSEQIGGAAIASKRLMQALNKNGVNASLLVRNKQSCDANVVSVNESWLSSKLSFSKFIWERLCIYVNNKFSKTTLFKVSIANTGIDITKHPLIQQADIIHLHWINQGFLSLDGIQQLIDLGKPIIWTMHDMWPLTAICHHAFECELYREMCERCVFLSNKKKGFSYSVWKKKNALAYGSINFVAVSTWLQNKAHQSSLMKNKVIIIPNVVDIEQFRSIGIKKARKRLNLSQNKRFLAMGAAKLNDTIKGVELLKQALSIVSEKYDNLVLLLFGEVKNDGAFFDDMPVEYIHYGVLKEVEDIRTIYAAADITVVPSLYETFGQTIIESMACKTPVVSFNEGGQVDIIEHKQNGYLAKSWDVEDFAKGIDFLLSAENYEELSENAFNKASCVYNEEVISRQYIDLYRKVLD